MFMSIHWMFWKWGENIWPPLIATLWKQNARKQQLNPFSTSWC